MKIAIITDMHLGVRGGSPVFLRKQREFFEKLFFPRLDSEEIKVIIDLGDTFDRRKLIDFYSLQESRDFFFDQIAIRNIEYHSIVGNHSVLYKNTNSVNSLKLLLGEYPGMHLYDNLPIELVFDKKKFILVPWLTADNSEESLKILSRSDADIVGGHFEIVGFDMLKGTPCTHGLDSSLFKKFSRVWSGHFHEQSEKSNIRYLGAPYEMTWSDYGGNRGFHIYDTATDELEFIQNPYRIFMKVDYEQASKKNFDVEKLKDAYVKMEVSDDVSDSALKKFRNSIEKIGIADLRLVESSQKVSKEESEAAVQKMLDVSDTSDTKEMISAYLNNVAKVKPEFARLLPSVEKLMLDLYNEALLK